MTSIGPRINLMHEWVVWSGPAARKGWYAERGDQRYEQLASSAGPFNLVTYGASAYNIMAQLKPEPFELPIFMQRSIQCELNTVRPLIDAPAPYPNGKGMPVFDQALRIIEPCTLGSYDWEQEAMLVPWLPLDYWQEGAAYQFAAGPVSCVGVGFTWTATTTLPIAPEMEVVLPGIMRKIRAIRLAAGSNPAAFAPAAQGAHAPPAPPPTTASHVVHGDEPAPENN